METLNNINQQFEILVNEKKYLDKGEFNKFLNSFKTEIEKQEKQYPRDQIIKGLEKFRIACSKSPFMKRAQTWPRGYQGDFETIDYIIKAKNQAKEGSFEYLMEDYFLKSDICNQHKNKVLHQADLIKEAILGKSDAKIISLGCGTSEDASKCIETIKWSSAELTLLDVDKDALAFSMQRLEKIKERITLLHGNIYKLMRNLSQEYDLILIGGVFDYLNDKTITSIIKSLKYNLTENGKIFFTNIDKDNPYRIFMEYSSDWFLIERSRNQLNELLENASWPEGFCKITKDKTGLTHLVELSYPRNISTAFTETERFLQGSSVCS